MSPHFLLATALATALSGGLLLALPGHAAAPASPPSQALESKGWYVATLRPVREGGAHVSAIDVTLEISAPASQRGEPLRLVAPIVYPGVPGAAERMIDLVIEDQSGPLPMSVKDDPAVPGGFPYFRHWTAERTAHYPVTVRYRAQVLPDGAPNGPPFAMRPVGGGVSGAGVSILIQPADQTDMPATLHWDLGDLPAGSIAVTSHGEGTATAASPSDLAQGWYLAGPAGRHPRENGSHGFSAAWLGTPTFDAPMEMAWAAEVYRWLAGYFPHLKPMPDYRVFMRFHEQPPYGGATALPKSFMLSRGPLEPGEAAVAPRTTLIHEMLHQWTGGIDAPHGISSWFSEGLTTYYQTILPARGNFETLDEYEAAINDLASDYYSNPALRMSAAEITKVGFSDAVIRHMPYQRGALYFADLDARIRAKSGGARTLETLLFQIFRERESGHRFDHARWLELITQELDEGERERFERVILEGAEVLQPASNAFGPCFARLAARYSVAGETREGFRWVRVPTVPEDQCRVW
ncbi:MAG TPA: hypothetical protein VIG90_11210 [Pedomonas sp.]|uniref:M61 family metallopeptidase n=1 Tax=Pedomonas sp. TaxID=2976421 RepID=UPI002F41763E